MGPAKKISFLAEKNWYFYYTLPYICYIYT